MAITPGENDIRTKTVSTFLVASAAMLGVIGVSVLVNWIDQKRLETAAITASAGEAWQE